MQCSCTSTTYISITRKHLEILASHDYNFPSNGADDFAIDRARGLSNRHPFALFLAIKSMKVH